MAAVVVVIEVLFQSTCLREARRFFVPVCRSMRHFNPRACVRHDRTLPGRLSGDSDFNPRACVRHDGLCRREVDAASISIHVPA